MAIDAYFAELELLLENDRKVGRDLRSPHVHVKQVDPQVRHVLVGKTHAGAVDPVDEQLDAHLHRRRKPHSRSTGVIHKTQEKKQITYFVIWKELKQRTI